MFLKNKYQIMLKVRNFNDDVLEKLEELSAKLKNLSN